MKKLNEKKNKKIDGFFIAIILIIMGINLVMPMGGSGSRFMGFDLPKPLIPIHDHPFLYWSTESVNKFVDLRSLTFVVLKEHIEQFNIDDVIYKYYPEAGIYVIDEVLNGAVLTCLKGVSLIDNNEPVLFNDCDHIFTCREFYDHCTNGDHESPDGALLTFTSNDPKFSFAQLDNNGNVIRTVEKEAISNKAICGAYYFKNRETFESAAGEYLRKSTYSEFYVSGVYNIMAQHKSKIRSFTVDMHLAFGTPEEYDLALKSNAFEAFK